MIKIKCEKCDAEVSPTSIKKVEFNDHTVRKFCASCYDALLKIVVQFLFGTPT